MFPRMATLSRRIFSFALFCWLLSVPALAQAPRSGALYIVSPVNEQKIDTSFVRVQFELVPGVSGNGIPRFRVQVDKETPVLTSDTEYNFFWLAPGWHSITVSLVDANGTPIYGVQDQVQFYFEG